MFGHIAAFYGNQYFNSFFDDQAMHNFDRMITYRFWTTLSDIDFN